VPLKNAVNSFTAGAQYLVNSGGPYLWLHDSDAANSPGWRIRSSGGALTVINTSGADSPVAAAALTITGGAAAVDSIALAGTTITLNGVAATDFARLSQANAFTGGAQTISHAATARLILTDGASSVYLANDASNAYMQSTADEVFQVYIGSSNFLAAEFGTTAATTKLAGVDATDFARLSQANVFTANQTLSKSSPVIALRDTSGSGSAVAAYVSLGDASTERGWVGFGAGTAVMGVTNNIGALALSATAITLNGKDLGAAVTTGAQTATFSATNKPGAGTAGPTTWLPITVSGTTYYIPCFGAG
jgi:hypothetical protein